MNYPHFFRDIVLFQVSLIWVHIGKLLCFYQEAFLLYEQLKENSQKRQSFFLFQNKMWVLSKKSIFSLFISTS